MGMPSERLRLCHGRMALVVLLFSFLRRIHKIRECTPGVASRRSLQLLLGVVLPSCWHMATKISPPVHQVTCSGWLRLPVEWLPSGDLRRTSLDQQHGSRQTAVALDSQRWHLNSRRNVSMMKLKSLSMRHTKFAKIPSRKIGCC